MTKETGGSIIETVATIVGYREAFPDGFLGRPSLVKVWPMPDGEYEIIVRKK